MLMCEVNHRAADIGLDKRTVCDFQHSTVFHFVNKAVLLFSACYMMLELFAIADLSN
jgi:hypothetical protein